jgi:hypothetical protein
MRNKSQETGRRKAGKDSMMKDRGYRTQERTQPGRKQPVCIYVDNSNIFIGGQQVAKARKEDPDHFRIDFNNFLHLITHGNMAFDQMVWAGSGTPDLEEVFNRIMNEKIDLQLIPRSESGENETVDQAIQLSMYRHTRKYRQAPGTLILCTGDGKGYHEEKGFLYDLQGFIEDGWQLILYSWDKICHKRLKQFARNAGEYIPLDKYYSSITFIKEQRHVMPFTENDKNKLV